MELARWQILKCSVCDSVMEVLDACSLELICCGRPMAILQEQDASASAEEHTLIVEETQRGLHVHVGDDEHPMDEVHHIRWIELVAGRRHLRHRLSPREHPSATFDIDPADGIVRAYCNRHGLWRSEFTRDELLVARFRAARRARVFDACQCADDE